jgi:amino acid adenylation domain-containing protein
MPTDSAIVRPKTADKIKQTCIHTLFEAQVNATPNALALEANSICFTYRELNQEANRIAHLLIEKGVRSEMIVGCYLTRSAMIVVYMLAILKAGGAYLLLDKFLPEMRLKHMVNNAEPHLVVADGGLPGAINYPAARLIDESGLQASKIHYASDNPTTSVQPHNMAYVAYTSGSTGVPKGVVITHAATANHARAFNELFELTTADRTPMLAPVAFDMATEEIIPALLAGATLMVSASKHDDMRQFHQEIVDNRYTILNVPVPLWYQWLEYLQQHKLEVPDNLRLVIVGSDKILTKKFREWQQVEGASKVDWVAAYGTTETTITSSFYLNAWRDKLDDEPTIPIGKPIANTTMYVLDAAGEPVKGNEVGELYIGGAGVARGYYKLEGKTKASFVPDPFSAVPHARMYKTGDEARFRPDGMIVCLGRKDSQVKIRSLRIELEEIEAVLLGCEDVAQAVAVVKDKATDQPYIHVFVIMKQGGEFNEAAVRKHARRYLHPLMLPKKITCLEAVPLTASGKLDRKRLEQYNTDNEGV